jgi:hypothetical protein
MSDERRERDTEALRAALADVSAAIVRALERILTIYVADLRTRNAATSATAVTKHVETLTKDVSDAFARLSASLDSIE